MNTKKCFTCLMLIGWLVSTGPLSAQHVQQVIDSLHRLLVQTTDTQQRIDLLNAIGFEHRRTEPDSLLYYAERAITLAREIDYAEGLASAYKNKGIAYFKVGTIAPDTIISMYRQAIYYAELTDDAYTQAACYNNIALVNLNNIVYHEALRDFLIGLEIIDRSTDAKRDWLKSILLSNIGATYYQLEDYDRAIEYLHRGATLADDINKPSVIAIYSDALAEAYMKNGDLHKAAELLDKALVLQDRLGDTESKVKSLIAQAELYRLQQDYPQALQSAEQAIAGAENSSFIRVLVVAILKLTEIQMALQQWDEALASALKAKNLAATSKYSILTSQSLETLATIYEQQGDYANADRVLREYIDVSLNNSERISERVAAELEAKFQNKERLADIQRLEEERTRQRRNINLLLLVLISGILLVLIAGWFYYQKYRATEKLNQRNAELAKAEQRLGEKNIELEQYIESNLQLENFAYLASHDLREPMRTIISFSQLLQRSAQDKLDTSEREYLGFVQQGIKRIEHLVNDLLTYSKINNQPPAWETVSTHKLIEQIRNDISTLIEENNVQLTIEPIPAQIQGDPVRLYQLFLNLITNAIKYRKPDVPACIHVQASETPTHHQFTITDNGIGIDPRFHKQIFGLFKTLQSKSVSESSGIGLAICKKIVEQHQGRIWLESEPQRGSSFHFTLAKEF